MAPRLQADIPTVDDSVAKLMHMGRETCRKLADLHSAAQQANMELDLDEHLACVEKVCVCGGGPYSCRHQPAVAPRVSM